MLCHRMTSFTLQSYYIQLYVTKLLNSDQIRISVPINMGILKLLLDKNLKLLIRKMRFYKLNFYWHIVDLHCCASFLLHRKVNQLYVYLYPLLFKILFLCRSLQNIG